MRILLIAFMSLASVAYGSSATPQDAPSPPDDAIQFGQWTFVELTDPLTDQRRGISYIESNGAVLSVKCDRGGRMYVAYSANKYLGSISRDRNREVVYRIDDRQPVSSRWSYLDETAISRNADSIAAAFSSGESVFIRATTFRYENADARFSLDGARDAMARAYRACGFNPAFAESETSDNSGQPLAR